MVSYLLFPINCWSVNHQEEQDVLGALPFLESYLTHQVEGSLTENYATVKGSWFFSEQTLNLSMKCFTAAFWLMQGPTQMLMNTLPRHTTASLSQLSFATHQCLELKHWWWFLLGSDYICRNPSFFQPRLLQRAQQPYGHHQALERSRLSAIICWILNLSPISSSCLQRSVLLKFLRAQKTLPQAWPGDATLSQGQHCQMIFQLSNIPVWKSSFWEGFTCSVAHSCWTTPSLWLSSCEWSITICISATYEDKMSTSSW